MVGWNHQTPTLFVEVVSWKPAMSDAEDRQIEQWKVKRLVKMLDAARGNLEQSIVLPSSKQTWQWKIPIFNRKYIFKGSIFHCYVSLPEGTP